MGVSTQPVKLERPFCKCWRKHELRYSVLKSGILVTVCQLVWSACLQDFDQGLNRQPPLNMQNLPSRAWSNDTLAAGLLTVDAQQMKLESDSSIDARIEEILLIKTKQL